MPPDFAIRQKNGTVPLQFHAMEPEPFQHSAEHQFFCQHPVEGYRTGAVSPAALRFQFGLHGMVLFTEAFQGVLGLAQPLDRLPELIGIGQLIAAVRQFLCHPQYSHLSAAGAPVLPRSRSEMAHRSAGQGTGKSPQLSGCRNAELFCGYYITKAGI